MTVCVCVFVFVCLCVFVCLSVCDLGVGDMSKNSYRDIFHCPDDIDIISRYVNKLHILL